MICRMTIMALALAGMIAAADKPAFMRVSQRDARYFELTDVRPYIPIGLNLIIPEATVDAEAGRQTKGHE